MRGAYSVAIALLVAAGSQSAAESDQYELQQRPDNDFMASDGTIGEMSRSRVLRESHNPKNDLMLSADDEERTPSAPNSFLTTFKRSDFMTADNVMRTKGEASAINAASKALNLITTNRRKHIAPTPNNVVKQVVRTPPNSDISLMAVENKNPLEMAKRRQTKHPTAITENAARSVNELDYRPAPSDPSTIIAEASNGRFDNQLTTKKALQLDKNEQLDEKKKLREKDLISNDQLLRVFDKSEHPTALNRQEANAIEAAPKNVKHLKSNKRKGKRIVSTPNKVVGQVLHAPPDPDESPVLVANNIPTVLAKRLDEKHPTAIMENAAISLKRHDYRPASSGRSTVNAEAPSDRHNKQPINQKAFQLDKNEHVDESFMREDLVSVKELLFLFEEYSKSSHPTEVNRQSGPKDWTNDIAQGPKLIQDFEITGEIVNVHEAFLKAFNLPFHQYIQETATMLTVVRYISNSSPNNKIANSPFRKIADIQSLEKLQQLLSSDLKKLLGDGNKMLPNNLENLKKAYAVKLIVMYDLFFNFCHDRKDLVKGLPRDSQPSNWILKLSTSNSENNNHKTPQLPRRRMS